MKEIYIFTDYRGQFYSSSKRKGASVDLHRLHKYFSDLGYIVNIKPFTYVDFRTQDYKDKFVLYQSSEDPGLFYKSYIDDLVFGFYLQKAKLIPALEFFKAHNNKTFMEVLRDQHSLKEIKNVVAHSYGTYEDYIKDVDRFKSDPYVIKSSAGSRSSGVKSLWTSREKIKTPKKISSSFTFQNIRYLWQKVTKGEDFLPLSIHRKKFIVQKYIPNLQGDYKVVVYNTKQYVFYRENRKGDFRASGSMKFNYLTELPEGMMDFAEKVYKSFNVPYISLDIAFANGQFFLLEFQFLCFGQRAIEKSSYYYEKEGNAWVKRIEVPDLEREIANSVDAYIGRNSKTCVE